jgi:DNA-binding beta-propeller fold protein YncE
VLASNATTTSTTDAAFEAQLHTMPPPALQLAMRGVALDAASGRLYVSVPELSLILVLNSSTTARLTHLGGGNSYRASPFSAPCGLVFSAGALYVADRGSNRVLVTWPSNGTIVPLAGTGTAGADDGAATAATFNAPIGLAMDAAGALYISDSGGQRIRRIIGGFVDTIAGNGSTGLVDGPGMMATFRSPRGLAVSPDGTVVAIADTGNNRLRLLTLDPVYRLYTVRTLAGGGPWWARTDGYGNSSSFSMPLGLARAADGTLLVADYGNAAIRVISPAGYVATLSATLPAGRPLGVADAGSGMMYATSTLTDGFAVRRVVPSPPPMPPSSPPPPPAPP